MNQPTPEEIAQVQKVWPAWDDLTVRRHLQQREELRRIAHQQRQERVVDALRTLTPWGTM